MKKAVYVLCLIGIVLLCCVSGCSNKSNSEEEADLVQSIADASVQTIDDFLNADIYIDKVFSMESMRSLIQQAEAVIPNHELLVLMRESSECMESDDINSIHALRADIMVFAATSYNEPETTTENHEVVQEISAWDGSIASGFEGGDGTMENPYEIATAEQLAYFSTQVNDGWTYEGQYYALTADIILNDFVAADVYYALEEGTSENSWIPWLPIGSPEEPFNGIFDGRGYTIYGMFITDEYIKKYPDVSSADSYVGLFGYIENASIYNVEMSNSVIYIDCEIEEEFDTDYYIGDLVGMASNSHLKITTISSCSSKEGYIFVRSSDSCNIGGLVGYLWGHGDDYDGDRDYIFMGDCINASTIIGIGSFNIGGVCGRASNRSQLGTVGNRGTMICAGGEYADIGGIVGLMNDASLHCCFNMGEMQMEGGGIVGNVSSKNAEIRNCYFVTGSAKEGYIKARDDSYIDISVVPESYFTDEMWLSENLSLSTGYLWCLDKDGLPWVMY